ncbi:hypothetical protein V6N13_073256 [Hibiscus sabdariffa]
MQVERRRRRANVVNKTNGGESGEAKTDGGPRFNVLAGLRFVETKLMLVVVERTRHVLRREVTWLLNRPSEDVTKWTWDTELSVNLVANEGSRSKEMWYMLWRRMVM